MAENKDTVNMRGVYLAKICNSFDLSMILALYSVTYQNLLPSKCTVLSPSLKFNITII